jgi:hypothetical protein
MGGIDQLGLPSAGREAAGAKVEGGANDLPPPLSSSSKTAGGHGQILVL